MGFFLTTAQKLIRLHIKMGERKPPCYTGSDIMFTATAFLITWPGKIMATPGCYYAKGITRNSEEIHRIGPQKYIE